MASLASFQLHPQLQADTHAVLTTALCEVRLMNDARFPWMILIPQRSEMRDVIDLSPSDQHLLWEDVAIASKVLRAIHLPQKLNVASLGNVVAQLHVHVIARFENDAAWPKPVWGQGIPVPYEAGSLAAQLQALRDTWRAITP